MVNLCYNKKLILKLDINSYSMELNTFKVTNLLFLSIKNIRIFTMITVKNLKHTTDKSCSCGSWLEHYYNYCIDFSDFPKKGIFISIPDIKCSFKGCDKREDLVGAHVKKVSPSDNHHYIIPMCRTHNHVENDDEMEVEPNTVFVSANLKETCNK